MPRKKTTARLVTKTKLLSVRPSKTNPLVKQIPSSSQSIVATKKSLLSDKRRTPSPLILLFTSLLRLLILGGGLAAIAGTVLTVLDPTASISSQASKDEPTDKITQPAPSPAPNFELALNQELIPLQQKIEKITAKYPKLQLSTFLVDLDNGSYVNLQGDAIVAAASTIKIPILVAFLQDVDAGKIYLDELLTIDKSVIAQGSGDMQYQKTGQKVTALETATKMITISDNTATNMLVQRLGGKEVLNQRFQEWGLEQTVYNNILPDLEGTNTTSTQDLVLILNRIIQGDLLSLKMRDRFLEIMQGTVKDTLLPQGLEKGAIIGHKTGDIGSTLGDAGIVDMPSGKRYLIAVMVKRPNNDAAAKKMIQEVSRQVYQHLKWYLPRQKK